MASITIRVPSPLSPSNLIGAVHVARTCIPTTLLDLVSS